MLFRGVNIYIELLSLYDAWKRTASFLAVWFIVCWSARIVSRQPGGGGRSIVERPQSATFVFSLVAFVIYTLEG